ncbi:MAG: hypothetical protein H0U13_14570 [Gemmatimonadaceae bacterium]|nr:hypothetical protein [Gemmatimonadaceae bacterium]
MAESHDSDRDTFTRILVALAVNDAEPPPTRFEIDQLADEVIEWEHHIRSEFRRAAISEQIAKLSRTEIEARLAAQLAPTACCTQQRSANVLDPSTLAEDDLRARLVEAEAFIDRMAA